MSRWALAVISLVVGFGIGVLLFRAGKETKVPGRGSTVIYVYEDPKDHNLPHVSIEEAGISPADFVFWVAESSQKNVKVEFKDEVFNGMTQDPTNHRWIPECKGRNCSSGTVKAGKGRYKYWQVLEDPDGKNRKEKDGWIIIEGN